MNDTTTRGTLSQEQTEQLLKPINPTRIVKSQHVKPHVSQQDTLAHLIRVFGFGNHDIEERHLELLYETERPKLIDVEENGRKVKRPHEFLTVWDCAYRAVVRLTIRNPQGELVAHYDGGSTGSAEGQPYRHDAHDLALKSALSTALKRAAIPLGDQFGLSLYNKGQETALVKGTIVGRAPQAQQPQVQAAPNGDIQEGVEQQLEDGGTILDGQQLTEAEASQERPEPSALPPARRRATNGTQGTRRTKAAPAAEQPASEPQAAAEPPAELSTAPAPTPTEEKAAAARETARQAGERKAAELAEQQRQEEAAARAKAEADAEAEEAAERARIAALQQRQAEAEAEEAATIAHDPATGEVPDAEPFPESDPESDPVDWMTVLATATTVAQVKGVWDELQRTHQMTTEARLEVLKHKARVEALEEARRRGEDDTPGVLDPSI